MIRFGDDFRRFGDMSAHRLADAEVDKTPMPKTFLPIDLSALPPLPPAPTATASGGLSWTEKMADVAKWPMGKARGLVWKSVRIQFVCPVTHQWMGSYDLAEPTGGFAAVATGMTWALYAVKVALATQGLGGVLSSDMFQTAESGLKGFVELCEAVKVDEGLKTIEDAPAVSAQTYRAVYDMIATSLDQDASAFDRRWKPEDSWGGMVLARCEGRAVWVSPQGAEVLRTKGLAALGQTVHH